MACHISFLISDLTYIRIATGSVSRIDLTPHSPVQPVLFQLWFLSLSFSYSCDFSVTVVVTLFSF